MRKFDEMNIDEDSNNVLMTVKETPSSENSDSELERNDSMYTKFKNIFNNNIMKVFDVESEHNYSAIYDKKIVKMSRSTIYNLEILLEDDDDNLWKVNKSVGHQPNNIVQDLSCWDKINNFGNDLIKKHCTTNNVLKVVITLFVMSLSAMLLYSMLFDNNKIDDFNNHISDSKQNLSASDNDIIDTELFNYDNITEVNNTYINVIGDNDFLEIDN